MTLMEILVSSSVLLLLLGLVYQVLTPSMHAWEKAQAETEAQQNALLTVEKTFQQIWLSTASSVTIRADGGAISFLNREAADGQALDLARLEATGVDTRPVEWGRIGIFWFESAARELRYKQIPYSGGSAVRRVPEAQLASLIADPAWPSRTVARNVFALYFSKPRPTTVGVDVTAMREWQGTVRETRTRLEILPRI